MTSQELRQLFITYFKKNGHRLIPSSSLIPENDPSVLFTTAGMQQFKPYYLSLKDPFKDNHLSLGEPLKSRNIITCQKCFRTTDINEVGDRSHLTFFEMLGNFSFGGYFKQKAIQLMFDFLFKELEIDEQRASFTFFSGNNNIPSDEESYQILKSLSIPEEKIKQGKEDNFWGPTGMIGPCGPTVEVYVDGIELWNLVFNEYYFNEKKEYQPLKQKGVDTGMGLERLTLITQFPQDETKTIFDTDLFAPLMDYLFQFLPQDQEGLKTARIFADHIKSIVFLLSEGILPSNTDRGYVVRRLIRRIARFLEKYQLAKEMIFNLVDLVVAMYSLEYPEIDKKEEIKKVLLDELLKFEKTLARGLKIFEELIETKEKENQKIITGLEAFNLYQSYGFPLELIKEMAQEKSFSVNEEDFQKEIAHHQEISRAGKEKKFGGHGLKGLITTPEQEKMVKLHTSAHLLLAALKKIVDPDIQQKGSDINSERLRFDFSLDRKLTDKEIKEIEKLINQKIQEGLEVDYYETHYEDAIKRGAEGVFKERYPEKVKVYVIKDKRGEIFSQEICAGPHVKNTQEIGKFKILKQESVSSGVKRIKAVIEDT